MPPSNIFHAGRYERLLIAQKYAVRRSEDLTFGIVSLVAAAPIADASPLGRYLLLTFERDESLSQNVVKVVRMGYADCYSISPGRRFEENFRRE
jgi:hypothetical protein